jgi:hypothetical protein
MGSPTLTSSGIHLKSAMPGLPEGAAVTVCEGDAGGCVVVTVEGGYITVGYVVGFGVGVSLLRYISKYCSPADTGSTSRRESTRRRAAGFNYPTPRNGSRNFHMAVRVTPPAAKMPVIIFQSGIWVSSLAAARPMMIPVRQ